MNLEQIPPLDAEDMKVMCHALGIEADGTTYFWQTVIQRIASMKDEIAQARGGKIYMAQSKYCNGSIETVGHYSTVEDAKNDRKLTYAMIFDDIHILGQRFQLDRLLFAHGSYGQWIDVRALYQANKIRELKQVWDYAGSDDGKYLWELDEGNYVRLMPFLNAPLIGMVTGKGQQITHAILSQKTATEIGNALLKLAKDAPNG